MRRLLIATGCALLGAAGCEGGGSALDGPWTGTVDTLDGGTVRVRSPDAPVQAPGEGPRLVERLRIGGGDDEAGPTFGQVPDIAPSGDGGVWVLDGEAGAVIRFDADGRELRRFGGPGESDDRFRYPRRLHLRGDTLWVEDLGAARWSAWSVEGGFLGVWPLPEGIAGGNASWTARGLVGVESRREGDDVERWAGRWVPGPDGFVRVDSLPAPPVPEPVALQATFSRQGRPVRLAFPVPLAHQPAALPDPDGSGWIVTPGGGEYRILRVDDDGTVRMDIVRDFTPVPVSETERGAAVERLPAELRDDEAHRVPTTWPPFDRVVPGADGSLWVVRRGAEGRPALDVFDARGRYRGDVDVALDLEGFWLHAADADGVWGVQRDDRGRPVVLRLVAERR